MHPDDPAAPFRTDVPGGIGPAEAARLRAAGLIRRVVADVHVPADVPEGAVVRASALLRLLPGPLREAGAVAGLAAAVWVHTGGAPPLPIDVLLAGGRGRPDGGTLRIRQLRLDADDVTELAGLRITTPLRTAVDLLRAAAKVPPGEAGGGPAGLARLLLLLRAGGLQPDDLVGRLARLPRGPGTVAARRLATEWLGPQTPERSSSPRRPITR